MLYMRKSIKLDCSKNADPDSGCEPLTPDDIAEVIVFAAGRRENVILADSLIFPNHQVRTVCPDSLDIADPPRLLPPSCTRNRED